MPAASQLVDRCYRSQTGPMLAFLTHILGDFSRAEEVWHDTIAAALRVWPESVPENPQAWLRLTGKRLAIDQLRRSKLSLEKSRLIQALAGPETPAAEEYQPFKDELLKLVFACCHPAIAFENRLALTLYAVCGLTTKQIADSLLLPKSTLEQRLTRAKAKLKHAGIGFELPEERHLPDRLDAVLKVIYLLFNIGYNLEREVESGQIDLAVEAVQLGNQVLDLLDNHPEAMGLLALMLFNLARRPARISNSGDWVLLSDQDRQQWDTGLIGKADLLLSNALAQKQLGSYQLQAAIAGVHCMANDAAATDWLQIRGLYALLQRYDHNPVIAVNAAVAEAMVDGEEAGLAALDNLQRQPSLARYSYLYAAKADLLRQKKAYKEATDNYRMAMELATQASEGKFYQARIAQIEKETQYNSPNTKPL